MLKSCFTVSAAVAASWVAMLPTKTPAADWNQEPKPLPEVSPADSPAAPSSDLISETAQVIAALSAFGIIAR